MVSNFVKLSGNRYTVPKNYITILRILRDVTVATLNEHGNHELDNLSLKELILSITDIDGSIELQTHFVIPEMIYNFEGASDTRKVLKLSSTQMKHILEINRRYLNQPWQLTLWLGFNNTRSVGMSAESIAINAALTSVSRKQGISRAEFEEVEMNFIKYLEDLPRYSRSKRGLESRMAVAYRWDGTKLYPVKLLQKYDTICDQGWYQSVPSMSENDSLIMEYDCGIEESFDQDEMPEISTGFGSRESRKVVSRDEDHDER